MSVPDFGKPGSLALAGVVIGCLLGIGSIVLSAVILIFQHRRINKSCMTIAEILDAMTLAYSGRKIPEEIMTKIADMCQISESNICQSRLYASEQMERPPDSTLDDSGGCNYEELTIGERLPSYILKKQQDKDNKTKPQAPHKSPHDPKYATMKDIRSDVFEEKPGPNKKIKDGAKPANDPQYQTLQGIGNQVFDVNDQKAPQDPQYQTMAGIQGNVFDEGSNRKEETKKGKVAATDPQYQTMAGIQDDVWKQ